MHKPFCFLPSSVIEEMDVTFGFQLSIMHHVFGNSPQPSLLKSHCAGLGTKVFIFLAVRFGVLPDAVIESA